MTNFIFKSQGTYKKLCQQLVIIQSELRHQRQDHKEILFLLDKLVVNKNLQTQVDDFYDEDPDRSTGRDETSPQTDLEDK